MQSGRFSQSGRNAPARMACFHVSAGRVVFAAGCGLAAAAVDPSACAGQRRRRHEPERRAKAALRLEA